MKYDFELELGSENNSLTKIISRIQKDSSVLEFGCANGRLTRYLKEEMNCQVTIVEIDEEAAEDAKPFAVQALCGSKKGDIEKYYWCKELDGKQYDFIVLADVLEHLLCPEKALAKMKNFLKPDGVVLVSIPNIANNAIVANLIQDEFKYTDIGLLDRTHVSFFTRLSFPRLLSDLGYYIYYQDATYAPISKSEVDVNRDLIDSNLARVLKNRAFGNIYQLIFEFGIENKNKVIENYYLDNTETFSSSMTFMLKDHDAFDSEHIVKKKAGGKGVFNYLAELDEPIRSIRFDPMETNGIVKFNHIQINKKDYKNSIISNCLAKYDNIFVYDSQDPMIIIEVPNLKKAEIEIDYEILDYDLFLEPFKEDFVRLVAEKNHDFEKSIQQINSELLKQQKITEEKEGKILSLNQENLSLNQENIEKEERIIELNDTINKNNEDIAAYQTIVSQQEEKIRILNEQAVISAVRLNNIKKRSTIFWNWLDKYNPLRYSREIDYCIDYVHVSLFHIKIKGWVISHKKDPIDIKGRPLLKINREIRSDVNRAKKMPDDYMSGFEIKGAPFLPLHLKFIGEKQKNIYFLNGTKLYIKYFKEMFAKVKKSIKKRGIFRTLLLSWYMATGRKHLYADSYDQWFALHKATDEELKSQRETVFAYQPLISIVIPTYNTPVKFLDELMDSIQNQTYINWEVCIADGNSSNKKTIRRLQELAELKKVNVKFLEKNYMISGNTNEGINMAGGEFVALMDHDDLIEPNALYEFVKILNENPKLDFIYSDEDKVSKNGKHFMVPHFKPDFSIDNLRSANYITHFVCVRKSILDEVGPFDSKCDGAQDYDMFLRIADVTKQIGHVSKILYHWRVTEKSTAQAAANKPYVMEAGKYALRKHLERNNIKGTVKDGLVPTFYKIDYDIIGNPKISIVIASKDHIEDLDKCIKSILNKSTYKNYEIIVVENNSEEKETFRYYKEIEKHKNIKVVYWKDEFNYSAINNYGVQFTTGDYILLLNNDIEVITPNWLEEMLMIAQRKDVGAVGAKLFYSDNTVQHAGVIVGVGGIAGHSHRFYPSESVGYVGRLIITQNLSAVTAACLMVKKNIFLKVNGLTEKYKVAFNDIDFCLKIRKLGYLNVMTPFAQLYHYESKSRGYEDTIEKQQRFLGEQNMFKEDWNEILEKGDPFYNPNLTLVAEDFSLKQL